MMARPALLLSTGRLLTARHVAPLWTSGSHLLPPVLSIGSVACPSRPSSQVHMKRASFSTTSATRASQAHTPGIAKIKNVVKHADPEDVSGAATSKSVKRRELDLTTFPPERIRNISIIAHIDHGKSTLADRLLELTGTIIPGDNKQVLDKLTVEKERGITVKAQTVSMFYTSPKDGERYLINLIDTPGHVDFSYEVSRSLSACDGCLLLVDASQGIQAQTLSVFFAAAEQDLRIIPVLNKVDLPHAEPEVVSETIAQELGIPQDEHLRISAKSGLGVDRVLEAIVHDLPATIDWRERARRLGPGPELGNGSTARALVFDTYYDRFRGVVCYIRVFSGELRRGDKLFTLASGAKYEVQEVGIFHPEETPVTCLRQGQVGYVVCNIKNPNETYVGDTLSSDATAVPLPGFKPLQSNIYAGVFPLDATELPNLEESIARLTLNDRSVTVQKESSTALGQGFRLGFLGTLHMDVWRQRLSDEYQADVIITAPSVRYMVKRDGGEEEPISKPAEFPEGKMTVKEPMVRATIVLPSRFVGTIMEMCSNEYRGEQLLYQPSDTSDRATLEYKFPLADIATNFFSDLKSRSSGYASFDYDSAGYEESDLVKLNILINTKAVDALAMVVHRSKAVNVGREWTKKLRSVIPKQLFEISIQAAIGGKIVARETVSAMRKNVTAGLYGGHYERKMKHLEKQKRGKAKLKKLGIGNVEIPQSAFFEVLSSR